MAIVVVFIELRDERATAPSLRALAAARGVSDELGASVYGLLATGALAPDVLERLSVELGLAGADKILFCADATLAAPALDLTHGALLGDLAERLRPLLFMFPVGSAGRELGPGLAVRTGAVYCPDAICDIVPPMIDQPDAGPQLRLRRRRAAGDGTREICVRDLERPVVALIGSTGPHAAGGREAAEIEMLTCPPAASVLAFEEVSRHDDEDTAVEMARVVIVIDQTSPADAHRADTGDLAVLAADAVPSIADAGCPSLVIDARGGHPGKDLAVPIGLPTVPDGLRAVVTSTAPSRKTAPPGQDALWMADPTRAVRELADALAVAASAPRGTR